MTDQPNNSPSTTPPVSVTARPREYLYFVSWTTGGRFGNCYLPLTFEITSAADVEWLRAELRRQGVVNAVVLSFALLPDPGHRPSRPAAAAARVPGRGRPPHPNPVRRPAPHPRPHPAGRGPAGGTHLAESEPCTKPVRRHRKGPGSMTNSIENSTSTAQPVLVTASPREYLYFVSWTSGGRFGNCYLMLAFEVTSKADVEWLRDELRRQGVVNAVVLSFALLPGGWGH